MATQSKARQVWGLDGLKKTSSSSKIYTFLKRPHLKKSSISTSMVLVTASWRVTTSMISVHARIASSVWQLSRRICVTLSMSQLASSNLLIWPAQRNKAWLVLQANKQRKVLISIRVCTCSVKLSLPWLRANRAVRKEEGTSCPTENPSWHAYWSRVLVAILIRSW